MTIIECIQCNKTQDCNLVTGKEIYPHRSDLYSKKFYQCPECKGYVGTHPDGRPLGCIVSKEIKNARIKIHSILDPLWKQGHMKRGQVYAYIKHRLGYHYHTAELKDIETAREVYKIVSKLSNDVNNGIRY